MIQRILDLVGLELTPNNHAEKLISGIGGVLAIALVTLITHHLAPEALMPVVASMGASAVLLFAAPHGPLSQPWPVAGGHLISAVVGVTAMELIPNPLIAGSVAVGVAITAMYYARCIHPPGGATALTPVLGGAAMKALGYHYVLIPVAVNVGVILTVAVAYNWWFDWRRYPAALARPHVATGHLTHEDWNAALTHVGSLADVTADELTELHELARQHAAGRLKKRPRRLQEVLERVS
jgi:CBS-domain-containing membrane protein